MKQKAKVVEHKGLDGEVTWYVEVGPFEALKNAEAVVYGFEVMQKAAEATEKKNGR